MVGNRNSLKIDEIPTSCGVYIFKDSKNKILYVGKATNLQKRVKSYFCSKNLPPKIEVLVSKVRRIEYFCTNTEKEALLLEASLIKKHKPRFNVVLRDDKNYLLFKLDKSQDYPVLSLTRKVKKDGCIYFGPFVSAKSARETLKVINRIFPIRKCKNSVFKNRIRPCLQYYIKRCLAPCVFDVDKRLYNQLINNLELFLSGKSSELLKRLENEMWKASENMEFEKAALLRDQINAIKITLEKQAVVDPESRDKDVIHMLKEGEDIYIGILFVRKGNLLDHKIFKMANPFTLEDRDILKGFLFQFYGPSKFIPDEIVLPLPVKDRVLEDVLCDWKGSGVKIKCAESWKDKDLLQLAYKNIQSDKKDIYEDNLSELKKVIKTFPNRIEAVDVSHIGGHGVVVGQIVYEDGHLKKDGYRIYKIEKLENSFDDYKALREWAKRRIKKGTPWPDLVLVDGGKGQLRSVAEEFGKHNLRTIIMAIAKPSESGKEDKIYLFEKGKCINIKGFKGLKFLQFLRDNVHRFTLSRQRKARKKDMISKLEGLNGIGPKTAKLLWNRFKSLNRILSIDEKELVQLPGIGEKKAEIIYNSLKLLKECFKDGEHEYKICKNNN